MRLFSYLNETEQNDKKYRDFSNEIYLKVLKTLETDSKLFLPMKNGYGLNLGNVDSRLNDVFMVLKKYDGNFSGAFTILDSGTRILEFNILNKYTRNLSDDLDSKTLKTNKFKEAFLHEFIHFLDWSRMKNIKEFNTAKKVGSDAYYNNPIEYNAFYQEAAEKMRKFYTKRPDKLPENMTKFLDKAYKTGTFILNNLNMDYYHKFSRRFSDLYLELKREKEKREKMIAHSKTKEQAEKMNLKYKGFGYWSDSSGKTTHKTVNDKIVKLKRQIDR